MSAADIVVGVDGSTDGRKAASWAVSWATAVGAPVRAIAAEPVPPGRSPESPGLGDKARAVLAEELEHLGQAHPGTEITGDVSVTHPVTALVRASESAGAVVVGTRGTGGWRGTLVGSVSGNVAAASYCPTVILPVEAPAEFDPTGPLVVGFDGSEASVHAARLALQAGAAEGRQVRLVQAEKGVTSPAEPLDDAVAALREEQPGVDVELVTVEGSAVDVLTEQSTGAAFVVVASNGHRGVPGFLLGSTTRALVQSASAPVLVLTERSERLWPVAQG